MASHGSEMFDSYARNLRRIFWAECIDVQTQMAKLEEFRPVSLAASENAMESLAPSFEYHRYRGSSQF